MLVDDFLKYLLADVPTCPPVVASRALIAAAMDICEETSVWNDILAPIPLVDDTNVYTLTAPTGAQVCSVMAVFLPSGCMTGKTMKQIAQLLPAWQSQRGTPVYFNQPADISKLRVFPIPFNSNGLEITPQVAYKPTLASDELPDVLVNNSHELLLHGAKWRLMIEPEKAWSNAELATYHGNMQNAGKADLRIAVTQEMVGAQLTATARPFGL